MSDNSEDSFIRSTSIPWYQRVPMPIWVALIGASATIFAAGLQSGWFALRDQPAAAEPTVQLVEVVEAATNTPAPQTCGPTLIHTSFKAYHEKYKDYLGCQVAAFNVPVEMSEQHLQGGHLFWITGPGNWTFAVFDQSKETGADLLTGEWLSATGTRNNPQGWAWDGTNRDGEGMEPPSPDLVEPTYGFGWLWRNHLGGPEGKLGWALDQFYGYNGDVGLYQEFERGFMFQASDPKIYILLDRGVFFAERPVE